MSRGLATIPTLVLALGCQASPRADAPPATPATAAAAVPSDDPATLAGGEAAGPLVITHAGVGSPPERAEGARAAAEAGRAALAGGGTALRAAVVSTMHMEDDPRFNAGTGANIRLDGRTIQMDAALMTSEGRFAALGVIERVKNPIAVAERVLETPHLFLAGEGATRFAHRRGFADVVPTCPEAEAKYRERLAQLTARVRAGEEPFDWRQAWNFPGDLPDEMRAWGEGGDTVGTVARAADGSFAATLSTGGTSVTLHGRVGDVPVYGCGCYAGPAGAVACTGHGEEIIKRCLARSVYEAMAAGSPAREAVRAAVLAFPAASSVGLIAVDARGWGVAANRRMAYGVATGE